MSWCFVCAGRDRNREEYTPRGFIWNFINGTQVISETLEGACYELTRVKSRQFWASETRDGFWDVQLTNSVVVPNIEATSVTEAVRIAQWKAYLDSSFKKVADELL